MRPRAVAVLFGLLAATGAVFYFWPSSKGEEIRIAFAGALSGGEASVIGKAEYDAVRMLVDDANKSGGVNGRLVGIDVHDDQDRVEKAQDVAYAIGQRGQAVAVIGHTGSATSMAAASIYARFEVPAISASATHDSLTSSNWYYRTVFNDSFQARFIARYARFILNKSQGVIIAGGDDYAGQLAGTVGKAAVDVGLNVRRRWTLSREERNENSKMFDDVAAFLAGEGAEAVVFLMAGEAAAKDVLVALKDRGVTNAVIGPDVLGRLSFAESFAGLAKERASPGFYTSGLYVTMPLIFDIASAAALSFKERFERTYGYTPPWEAAFAYDAAALALHAAAEKKLKGGADSVRSERAAVRDYLKSMDGPERAFAGIAGAVYFEGGGDPKKPISMAMFQNGVIAPLSQLTQVANPKGIRDLDKQLTDGKIVRFEDQYMYRNSIVYTGLRPAGNWVIDPAQGTFTAEFDLWFRYQGDVPVADLVFLNAAVGEVKLGEPVKAYSAQGVNYAIYRVKGPFRLNASGEATAYGHQFANIVFRNRQLTSEQLVYVPDGMVLPKTNKELARDFSKTGFLSRGALFKLDRASIYSDRLPAESMGEPDLLDNSVERFPFSTYTLALDVSGAGAPIRRAVTVMDPLWYVIGLGGALLVLLAADKFARRSLYRRVLFPLWGVAAVALLYMLEIALVNHWLADSERAQLAQVVQIVDMLFWLLGAILISTFLERFVWPNIEALMGRAIPRVVRSSAGGLVYLLALLGIVAFVFHQPVTLVLAALGLMVTIIGFAIHRDISSVFSGIALNFENAFAVGDWVRVPGHGEGRVLDMSWRATKLRTAENHIISIPNTVMAESVLDRPEGLEGHTREWIEVMVDPAIEPARVIKILADAAMLVRKSDGFAEGTTVRFAGIDDWSARYRVYFPVGSYEERDAVLDQIWTRIRAALNFARINPVVSGRLDPLGLPAAQAMQLDPRNLLARVPIFAGFSIAELGSLADQVTEITPAAGIEVVRQGDPGDSLFIVGEGVVSVLVQFPDKPVLEVARLGPGDYFGEMALLTGDKRTATVRATTPARLFEVTKAVLAPVVAQRRELVDTIAGMVELRMRANSDAKARSDAEAAAARNTMAARISAFLFG